MSLSGKRIDQLMAGMVEGDATSRAALAMREALRAMGYMSEIYALPEHVSPSIAAECLDLRAYRGREADVALHHYGIRSEATERFTACAAHKVLLYHNITPAGFYRGYDDALEQRLEDSRRRLKDVADACRGVWADSEYNAAELSALGVRDVKIFPLPFTAAPLDIAPDPSILARYRVPLTNLLFVGRIAPNKRLEDLLEAYAWYHDAINPRSRLLLVGSERSAPAYFTVLRMLASDLGVPNVCFEGFASPAGLAACYRLADLFACTSGHEGYCLPLLEAMYCGVPVVARRTGGTPEAMRNAGVLYDGLSARQLAELMHLVLSDPALHAEIGASQRARMQEVLRRDLAGELKVLLAGA